MPKKTPPETPLYVRLPAQAIDKLERAAGALGVHKKALVAGLVTKYVDPDSQRGLSALSSMTDPRRGTIDLGGAGPTLGTYSFQPDDPPEVMNAAQAGHFLQTDEATIIEMAKTGKLPGRKVGTEWRFSRAAIVAWLALPEKR